MENKNLEVFDFNKKINIEKNEPQDFFKNAFYVFLIVAMFYFASLAAKFMDSKIFIASNIEARNQEIQEKKVIKSPFVVTIKEQRIIKLLDSSESVELLNSHIDFDAQRGGVVIFSKNILLNNIEEVKKLISTLSYFKIEYSIISNQ